MKKPEKKLNPEGLDRPIIYGYNQACDDWEKYHASLLKEIVAGLPSWEEIRTILIGYTAAGTLVNEASKAIHDRIKG